MRFLYIDGKPKNEVGIEITLDVWNRVVRRVFQKMGYSRSARQSNVCQDLPRKNVKTRLLANSYRFRSQQPENVVKENKEIRAFYNALFIVLLKKVRKSLQSFKCKRNQ